MGVRQRKLQWVWLLCCFIVSCGVWAQSTLVDSLLTELETTSVDTQRVGLLIEVSKAYDAFEKEKSFHYGRQAYRLIKPGMPVIYRVRAFENLAFGFLEMNHLDSAIYYSDKCLPLIKDVEDDFFISFFHRSRSIIYRSAHNYPLAIYNAKVAAQASERVQDTAGMVASFRLMSLAFDYQGDIDSSYFYSFAALKLAKKIRRDKEVAWIYSNLASSFNRNGEYDKALAYQRLAMKAYVPDKKETFAFTIYNNLGVYYKNLDSLDNSRKCYDEAMKLAIGNKDTLRLSMAQLNIGKLLLKEGRPVEAEKWIVESINLSDNKGYVRVNIAGLHSLASLNVDLRDYKKGIAYYEAAYKKAQNAGYASMIRDLREQLSIIYSKIGDYKKAFLMQVAFKAISDSLLDKDKVEEITRMSMQYSFDIERAGIEIENLKEVHSKEVEISKQTNLRNIAFGGLAFFVLIGGGGFVFFQMRHKEKEHQMKDNLYLFMQKSLSQQMTPHFFFNALTTIQSYILANKKETSIDYVSKFAKLMRQTLENYQYHSITIEQELAVVHLYVELEKANARHGFRFIVDVDPEIDGTKYKVPTFIIQPLIENAIKHGIKGQEEGCISLKISMERNVLVCRVSDDGVGLALSKSLGQKKKHKSMATSITQKRLTLLSEYYKQSLSISYDDIEDSNGGIKGTSVKLVLPLIV